MEGIMTVGDLIDDLSTRDMASPVMIAVVKYPEEFAIRFKDGVPCWADSSDVECVALESGEVTTTPDGLVMIAVELTEYDAQRHFAGG